MANNLIPEELNALIKQYREGQGPVPWPRREKALLREIFLQKE